MIDVDNAATRRPHVSLVATPLQHIAPASERSGKLQ